MMGVNDVESVGIGGAAGSCGVMIGVEESVMIYLGL